MAFVEFNREILHMDVLCVRQYNDFILAGIGNNLYIYKNASFVLSKPVFKDERVHSICIQNDLILLKGGRQLSIAKLTITDNVSCEIVSQILCSDWIQDVIVLENQLAGLVTAHNAFECWDVETQKHLSKVSCEETCILYSCKIIGDSVKNVVIFAGTVFGDVLIWAPCDEKCSLLQRLKAHNGAVFSIDVKPLENLITTTSDDRSLKVWSVTWSHPNDWKSADIQLIHTLFGHTARVWKSMILPTVYITAGEDSQLVVWSRSGRMVKTLSLHQESGIRALDYSAATNSIITGGEDGGVNGFSLDFLLQDIQPKMILDLGNKVSTKVSFTHNGLVYTLNGACVLLSQDGEEVLYESEKFSSYCVLETSPEGEYIVLGSITGDLVLINLKTRGVTEDVVTGRVYSIHWCGNSVVTCGTDGNLTLWEISGEVLRKVNTMTLPNSRERWTTCGAIHNGQLIVGDRMGGIHLYDLRVGGNPLKTIRKVHGYLGVTDIKHIEGVCYSLGRDGTVKQYTEGVTLETTDKLPMEWPWRIVSYNDDVLVLGFRSVSFIVWSMKTREIIATHDCGGGHRSCVYKIQDNNLSFLYVKDKKVFLVHLPLDGVTRIRSGFHGREINCLKVLKTDPTVIITGSEDTTLRVSVIDKSDVRQIHVLKTHTSSVRAVSGCYTGPQKMMVVSAGGKGQMVVWDLDLTTLKCRAVVNHRLKKEERNWKSCEVSADPETRIMCVDIIKRENEFLIAIGCSDCHVRMFSYGAELKELCVMSYTHCVLNLSILKAGAMRVLASMGTDGKVVFWEITDRERPAQLAQFSLHQSGINSFHFEEIECGKYILATGGDDNLISLAFVDFDETKVTLRRLWENATTHSCQITGIKILEDFLITTSIDQRITVWKWSFRNGFTVSYLNQCMTAVPDIQGMDVTRQKSAIMVTVYGKGLETLLIDIANEASFKIFR